VSVQDVTTIATLNAQHADAIAAARVVDPATITALVLNPNDAAAAAKAVQEVVTKLGISPADAQARLKDITSVPVAQLQLLQTSGPKVINAQRALVALGKIPASDLAALKEARQA